MCAGGFFTSMIALVINTYYTGKLIGVGYFRQMQDLFPTFILSISMGAIVYYAINSLSLSPIAQLGIGICIGIIYYISMAFSFKFTEVKELIDLLKRKQ